MSDDDKEVCAPRDFAILVNDGEYKTKIHLRPIEFITDKLAVYDGRDDNTNTHKPYLILTDSKHYDEKTGYFSTGYIEDIMAEDLDSVVNCLTVSVVKILDITFEDDTENKEEINASKKYATIKKYLQLAADLIECYSPPINLDVFFSDAFDIDIDLEDSPIKSDSILVKTMSTVKN